MTMTPQGRKQKGMQGEYEVRDILQKAINEVYAEWNKAQVDGIPPAQPPTLGRNLEQRRWKAVDGKSGSDIDGVSWAAVEVKRQEDDSMLSQWWEQTKYAARCRCEEMKGENVVWNCTHPNGFAREPILIWRKNWMPWRVRMFGFLLANDVPGGTRVRLPVDINLLGFLAYFKARCLSEIGKELTRRP